jgi:hypothetical protein
MYLEVVKDSWDFYINWFSREIGKIDYQDYKDGEIDVIDADYLANEIGYVTTEYENDKSVNRYFIQIENQYFLRFCEC